MQWLGKTSCTACCSFFFSTAFLVKCLHTLYKNICPILHSQHYVASWPHRPCAWPMLLPPLGFQTVPCKEISISVFNTLELLGRCQQNELTDFLQQDLTQHIFFTKCSRVSWNGLVTGRSAYCCGVSSRWCNQRKETNKNIQLFWTYHKFLDTLFPIETWNGLLFEKIFTNLMFRGLCD